MPWCACASEVYTVVCVCVCACVRACVCVSVCVYCYSCSRVNKVQVKISYASSHTVDLQNNALLTWNALQPFQRVRSKTCPPSVSSSALERYSYW